MSILVRNKNFERRVRQLQILNIVLGCVHLGLAIYVFVKRKEVNPRINEIPILKSEVFVGDNGSSYGIGTVQTSWTANIVNLIAMFFLITSLFHFAYAAGAKSWYKSFLAKGSNPLRWLEYSITATIMAMIVALSATVQIQQQLLLIMAMTVVIMLLGNVIEKSVAAGEMQIARQTELFAWLLQLAVFYVIAEAFITTIKRVNEKLSKENAKEFIPSWVYVLLIAQLVFYSLFGFVSAFQVYSASTGKKVDFVKYETAYHLLSVISKMTLGLVFFLGASQNRS